MKTTFMAKRRCLRMRLAVPALITCMYAAVITAAEPEWIPLIPHPGWGDAPPAAPSISHVYTDRDTATIIMDVPGFWQEDSYADGENYQVLNVEGWSSIQQVGAPALPFCTIMLDIPHGKTARVSLISKERVPLEGYHVFPSQPPPPDVMPEPPPADFAVDQDIYASDNPFPAQPLFKTEEIGLKEKRILVIRVSPFILFPESGQLEAAYHMELEVTFTPSEREPFSDVEAATTNLPIYMILMDDQFASNTLVSELADWKRRKGYRVVTVKTSDIEPGGAPSNTDIVNYMRALDAGDYPDYLLILGDHTADNGVAGNPFNSYTTTYSGFTDLDIACRNDSDYWPDLYYGRLPATNTANASNMLFKVLAMDRTPPTGDMFERVCIAGQIQEHDSPSGEADRLFCETADAIACYFEQDANGVDYTCSRAIVNPDGANANCTWNSSSIMWLGSEAIGTRVYDHFLGATDARNRIIDQVNQGTALVQHRDHGYINGVGWADPYFVTYYVNNSLNNTSNRPVVFSVNCNSGMYQYPDNFARAWIQHANGGAYAVYAPVDTSYSWYNDWMTHGFFTAFLTNYTAWHNNSSNPDWGNDLPAPSGSYGSEGEAKRLGQVLNFGKFYMYEKYWPNETTFRLFHLLGDPESYLRIEPPAALSVSHPADALTGLQTITVNTGETGCEVGLYSSELDVHQYAVTESNSVDFEIFTENTGTLYVTVYRHDRRPYEGEIDISGSLPVINLAITDITLASDGTAHDGSTAFISAREDRTGRESGQEYAASEDVSMAAYVTVQNQGTDTSSGGDLSVWANCGAQLSVGATGEAVQALGTLSAGESRQYTFTGLDAGDGTTRRAFRAFADSQGQITETNEHDNQGIIFYPDTPILQDFAVQASAGKDAIQLNWTDPVAAGYSNSTVLIRWSTNTYPAGLADGELFYQGYSQSATHASRPPNVTCYYRIWVSQNGSHFVDPAGTSTAAATPQRMPLQLVLRSSDTFIQGGKPKTACRIIPFRGDGSGVINTGNLPETFNLATRWSIEGCGEFNTNMPGDEILLRDVNGNIFLLYMEVDGSPGWNTDTNSIYWTSFSAWTTYTTNTGHWYMDAIGDVNGDGSDEILVRSDEAYLHGGKMKTDAKVLMFDPAGTGQLADDQPDAFRLANVWTIEGLGRFNHNPPGGTATNAAQLLLRHVNNGGFYLLYFSPDGSLYWNAGDTNDLCWTSYTDGAAYAEQATDWSVSAIGDINGDQRDEILLQHNTSFEQGGKTKYRYQLLLFDEHNTGRLKTQQPASFNIATLWRPSGLANMNFADIVESPCADQLIIQHQSNGGFYLLYFNDDGTLYWEDSDTNNVCWTSFTRGGALSTNAASWSAQGIGDVMGTY